MPDGTTGAGALLLLAGGFAGVDELPLLGVDCVGAEFPLVSDDCVGALPDGFAEAESGLLSDVEVDPAFWLLSAGAVVPFALSLPDVVDPEVWLLSAVALLFDVVSEPPLLLLVPASFVDVLPPPVGGG